MKKPGTTRIVDPGVRTTAGVGREFNDAFVPGWDKTAGAMQHYQRLAERQAMGQKTTPVGRTRLKPNNGG